MIASAFFQTVDNVKNHASIAWSGIATASISLIILGSIILVYFNVVHFAESFFNNSRYSIFLQEDISPSQKESLLQTVRAIWGAGDVREIGSEQSRQELLQSLGEARKLLENVTLSKLPDIVEFSLQRSGPLTKPELSEIKKHGGVDEIVSGHEIKDQIELFFFVSDFVGGFLIGISILSIVFIIRNSIQIGVRVRIKEIEILKVLGATKWFIRLPYLFEGVFIAVVSFFLSLSVVYFLFQFVVAGITFNEATYGIEREVRFFPIPELGFVLIGLTFLGMFSSMLATDRVINQLEP